MFSVFLELVKRVGIFVIIGQTILHFGISQKYEKYMKLVVSFMIAAQIVFAFGVYLKQEDDSWKILSVEEYRKAWEVNMKKMEEVMEEGRKEMVQSLEEKLQEPDNNVAYTGEWQENSIRIEKIVIQ